MTTISLPLARGMTDPVAFLWLKLTIVLWVLGPIIVEHCEDKPLEIRRKQ